MAHRKKKITKYRKPLRINIGVIIFLFVFLYVTVNVFLYFSKDQLSIYEVTSASIADNNTMTGIAIRKEKVYTAKQSGYVNYFVSDTGRVAKNDIIYTLDENGTVFEKLTETEWNKDVNKEITGKVKELVYRHDRLESEQSFSEIYELHTSVMNEVYDASGVSMLKNLKTVMGEDGAANTFHVNYTDDTGDVAFYSDSYEDKKVSDITAEDFTKENYKKVGIRNSSLVEKGEPVYKLVSDETWNIVLPITQEQYTKLSDRSYVDIVFEKDKLETTAAVEITQKGTDYFAVLTLSRYMVRYLNDRYLEITLILNNANGLKIPASAIVEKTFFKVPVEYFTAGGDTSSNGLIKESFDDKGNASYTFTAVDIYYNDGEYAYIIDSESGDFEAGSVIKKTDSDETFRLSETDQLEGVYNVNKGYCVFRRIVILYRNEEYCIVEAGTQFGLSEYDHIVLQGDMAEEQAIIY